MDVAGTFFTNLKRISIALQDKSVLFHFTKNSDLYGLDFFEFTSVHLSPQKNSQRICVAVEKLRAEQFSNLKQHNGTKEKILKSQTSKRNWKELREI